MTTTNMNITLPIVQTTLSPTWAAQLNEALLQIDEHDHSNYNGVKITNASIDVDDNLNFNDYNVKDVTGLYFIESPSLGLVLSSCFVWNGELYYRDGSNNIIKITNGGSINLTSRGIEGDYGTAGALVTYNDYVKKYSFIDSAGSTAIIIIAGLSNTTTLFTGNITFSGEVVTSEIITSAGTTITLANTLTDNYSFTGTNSFVNLTITSTPFTTALGSSLYAEKYKSGFMHVGSGTSAQNLQFHRAGTGIAEANASNITTTDGIVATLPTQFLYKATVLPTASLPSNSVRNKTIVFDSTKSEFMTSTATINVPIGHVLGVLHGACSANACLKAQDVSGNDKVVALTSASDECVGIVTAAGTSGTTIAYAPIGSIIYTETTRFMGSRVYIQANGTWGYQPSLYPIGIHTAPNKIYVTKDL